MQVDIIKSIWLLTFYDNYLNLLEKFGIFFVFILLV